MFTPGGSDHFWIVITNVLLGLFTIGLLIMVVVVLVKDLLTRRRGHTAGGDAYNRLELGTLGITLPDGGEPIDEIAILKKPRGENSPGPSSPPTDSHPR